MPPVKRRALTIDEDTDFDQRVFDRAYWPKRVYRHGHGPHVSLMLTDHAPPLAPSSPPRAFISDAEVQFRRNLLDWGEIGAAHAHSRPHQATLSDAELARREADYLRRCRALADAWRYGPGSDPSPDEDEHDDNAHMKRSFGDPDGGNGDDEDLRAAADQARAEWIDRTSRAWQEGAPGPMWRGASAGPTPGGAQYSGPGSYAKSVWAAQAAITPGSPDAWRRVVAEGRITKRESQSDSGEDARDVAWRAYCDRISSDWKT